MSHFSNADFATYVCSDDLLYKVSNFRLINYLCSFTVSELTILAGDSGDSYFSERKFSVERSAEKTSVGMPLPLSLSVGKPFFKYRLGTIMCCTKELPWLHVIPLYKNHCIFPFVI